METIIPVILFVYARPDHLRRTLESLRINNVPVLYIFSDGPKTPDKEIAVREVRKLLRQIDWCKTIITEQEKNLGLGQSILTGVTEVFQKEEAAIVFEDDLICVPGTYAYMCSAMEHYRDDPRVMSVTGWTHPLVTPRNITDQPYFDGRAESLTWGTWASLWKGMHEDAKTLMDRCKAKGIDVNHYGTDLPEMAIVEQKQNIWAVRFLFWHILNSGLCLRPPWSMVEHIGWDSQGTNAQVAGIWAALPLKICPPIPTKWPEPVENPECADLYHKSSDNRPVWYIRIFNIIQKTIVRGMQLVYPQLK